MTTPLPAVIAEIAEVAGHDAAWSLARAKGGQQVFIPATIKPDHWLVGLVGIDAALKICGHFSVNARGVDVLIPMAVNWRRRDAVMQALAEGKKVDEAAAVAGVHRRTVLRHKKRGPDDRQGKLSFD